MVFTALKTLPRDARFVARIIKAKREFRIAEKQNQTVGRVFDALAKKHPDKVCFYFGDEKWTYRRVELETNKIGNYYASQGLRKNDVVPLFMENRIEFLVNWVGLSKIGVVPALLNSQLRAAPLQHSVELIKPKAIICGYELSSALGDIYPNGETKIPVFGTGRGDRGILSKAVDIDPSLSKVSAECPKESDSIAWNDDLFYIYTSGTTGLPKAAIFKQSRYIAILYAMRHIIDVNPKDTIYTTFPLYHTAGGIIASGMGLILGIPVVVRDKFSAKNFWKDCIKYNVTGAQYMGETCRYLLRQPATPEEKQHKLRLMFGNGLRQEIWTEFKERFNIPLILEMYGATEGNSNIFNLFGHHGAVGFIPPIFQRFWPLNIFKLDENEEPVRDPKTGLCVKVKTGEVGELFGQIIEGEPGREFKGYAGDVKATKKKILKDVFKKGDQAFRSGDMLVRDKEGYYYFKDRIGDTFRWKAENVSTAQVESILSTLIELQDVVVYGVQVPNCDGRAGMAAIADPNNKIDLKKVAEGLIKALPPYAIPVFLRIRKEIELTGTHKMKKFPLQKQGIDLNQIKDDQLYFFDKTKYVPLTKKLYDQIISGEIKL